MLIIEREPGQSFYLGKELGAQVKILGTSNNGQRIRIGIEAPKHIPVHRNKDYVRGAA